MRIRDLFKTHKYKPADRPLTPHAEMYVEAYAVATEDTRNGARDAAIAIITSVGYGPQTPDVFGEEHAESVQTHLMIAFLRSPELIDRVYDLMTDIDAS